MVCFGTEVDAMSNSFTPNKWQKPRQFTRKRSVALSPETDAAVNKIAEAAGWSAGTARRECVMAGLPVLRERLRSKSRRKGADGGAQ